MILDMAAYAPSSWGRNPVEYIVVQDKKIMAELARCKAMGAGSLAYGEDVIVPIIDKRNLELWVEDAAVASTYILFVAEYYGVGLDSYERTQRAYEYGGRLMEF